MQNVTPQPELERLDRIRHTLAHLLATVVLEKYPDAHLAIGPTIELMLGGMLMGLAETAVVAFGKSTYRDAIAFAILIVILLIRPRGLLGAVTEEKV